MSTDALAAVERMVGAGGDPDDVLRGVVDELVEHGGCTWAGIRFREDGAFVAGPQAGTPTAATPTLTRIVYDGADVAELATEGRVEPAVLDRVAELIAVHCLVGWDTGGEPWDPND